MNNVRQLFDSGWYTVKYSALQSDPLTDQINLDRCLQERSSHILADAALAILSTVCYPALAIIVTLGEVALLLDLALRSERVKSINRRITQLRTEDVSEALQARLEVLKKQLEQTRKQLDDIKLEYSIGLYTLPKEEAIKAYYAEKKDSEKWSERMAAHNYLSTLSAWEKAVLEWSKLHEAGSSEESYRRLQIAELKLSLVKSEIGRQVHLHQIHSIALLLIPVVGFAVWLHLGKTIHDELQPDAIDDYNQKIRRCNWLPRY